MNELCRLAKVSRSSYYSWRKGDLQGEPDEFMVELISEIHEYKHKKAGIRTIRMELDRQFNLIVNLKKIARIKRQYGLATVIRRKNKYKSVSKLAGEHAFAPNILNRNFSPSLPDQVYVTDITYLNFGPGKKAYLSVVKDLGSSEIVHHHVSSTLGLELPLKGLENLLKKLPLERRLGLIFHSDQGFHFTHSNFRETLAKLSITQSMSRKGNCLDNASVESFFGHFKDEIELGSCNTLEDLAIRVSKYLEYYNNDRPQWGLNQKTPAESRSLKLGGII